ncbi:E3 ubiquitin-protein ligase Hakai [Halotydeus destructor]|nr:E3 ubiquitin-protein ligase Hakai [Halotydeus destructor]
MDSDDDVQLKKGSKKKRVRVSRKNSASKIAKPNETEPDVNSSSGMLKPEENQVSVNASEMGLLEDSNISITFSVGSKVPLHNNKPLSWNHKVNLIGEKVQNPKLHKCDECKGYIANYGRMIPCKHVFCYDCGLANSVLCKKCGDRVIRVEKTGLGSVYKCEVENCARTYLSSRDLQAHIHHRHMKKNSTKNLLLNARNAAASRARDSPSVSTPNQSLPPWPGGNSVAAQYAAMGSNFSWQAMKGQPPSRSLLP